MATNTKRMSRDSRRQQLLDVARAIIRNEGTESLTLGHLADRAGVTKPVTYDHFGDRDGLLIALYQAFDDKQAEALRGTLVEKAVTPELTLLIFADAYVNCAIASGPEIGPVVAALCGSDALRSFLNDCRSTYTECLRVALNPFVAIKGARGDAALLTMIGAAEAISAAAGNGQVLRAMAVEMLYGALEGTLMIYAKTLALPS
jgi:AcrR family transcriptional regulator